MATILLPFPPKLAVPFSAKTNFLNPHNEPLVPRSRELSLASPPPAWSCLIYTALHFSCLICLLGLECRFSARPFVPSDLSQGLPEPSFLLCNRAVCAPWGTLSSPALPQSEVVSSKGASHFLSAPSSFLNKGFRESAYT